MTRTWRDVYRWPMLLAFVITAGLLFALLGNGIWDAASWLLLAMPLLLLTLLLLRKANM